MISHKKLLFLSFVLVAGVTGLQAASPKAGTGNSGASTCSYSSIVPPIPTLDPVTPADDSAKSVTGSSAGTQTDSFKIRIPEKVDRLSLETTDDSTKSVTGLFTVKKTVVISAAALTGAAAVYYWSKRKS